MVFQIICDVFKYTPLQQTSTKQSDTVTRTVNNSILNTGYKITIKSLLLTIILGGGYRRKLSITGRNFFMAIYLDLPINPQAQF